MVAHYAKGGVRRTHTPRPPRITGPYAITREAKEAQQQAWNSIPDPELEAAFRSRAPVSYLRFDSPDPR